MKGNTIQYWKIVIALVLISISAQITINVGSIPITGQSLSVLMLAFFLSWRQAAIATLSYLLLGALGMPIFADGASGFEKLTGGSGGFLIGFVFSSTLVSYWFRRMRTTDWLSILLLTFFGTVVILIAGIGRLSMLYGFEKAIAYGLTPFWKGAVVKILIGTIGTWVIKKKITL